MAGTAPSVLHLLAERAASAPDADALLVKRYGRWEPLSIATVLRRVAALAHGFAEAGVGPGTVVALVMRPHAQRILTDLALQAIGAPVVGIPTGMPEDQIAHLLRDSRATWVVVQNQHLADIVLPLVESGQAGDVERIAYVDAAGVQDYGSPLLTPFAGIEAAGTKAVAGNSDAIAALLADVRPDAVAAINYSSGTTGPPRGVLLTNANLRASTQSTIQALGLAETDRVLSFRPLSDPVERGATIFPALTSGALLALPESRASAQTAMWEIAPTYIHLTPRYIKSIATGIRVRMQGSRGLKRRVSRWWVKRFQEALEADQDVSPTALSRRVIGFPVLEKLGLDAARHVVVSGSRIPTEGLAFFAALGLTVRPAYSLTEVGGFALLPQGATVRRNTLGTAVPGLETRIDGRQLLIRGEAVAAHALESDGGRAALLDQDGWLATGDVAMEVDGEIAVRGRLGDMIGVHSGEGVNLMEIEASLTASPYIREAILTPDGDDLILTLEPEGRSLGRWATRNGVEYTTERSLLDDERIISLLHRAADTALESFGSLPITRTHILTLPLAVADGTLTLNDKVRRNHVREAPFKAGTRDSVETDTPQTRESTGAK
ncbi:AMP-binding protein [Euzebya tangerina]|uniref:AMP-binding protein n=1 Tax=Euzebya tangerina TaxID=591198 RepID=UPI000E30C423|nr:AMP-binding protein [Euzebya tangerina]